MQACGYVAAIAQRCEHTTVGTCTWTLNTYACKRYHSHCPVQCLHNCPPISVERCPALLRIGTVVIVVEPSCHCDRHSTMPQIETLYDFNSLLVARPSPSVLSRVLHDDISLLMARPSYRLFYREYSTMTLVYWWLGHRIVCSIESTPQWH